MFYNYYAVFPFCHSTLFILEQIFLNFTALLCVSLEADLSGHIAQGLLPLGF